MAHIINPDNVGVVKLSSGPSFTGKSTDKDFVFLKSKSQDLEGHGTVHGYLNGAENGPHPAMGDLLFNHVTADLLTDERRQIGDFVCCNGLSV